MPRFHVDSSNIRNHVNTLQLISRSALPVAIRQTLNDAAIDVKKVTMPETAKRFTQRRKTFLKANSRVEFAKGLDVNTMRSAVGFVPLNKSDKGHAVQDLEQQEDGGEIKDRSFIALPGARGGKWQGNVKNEYKLAAIMPTIIAANTESGRNAKAEFIAGAYKAGPGGIVIGNRVNKNGNKTAFKVIGLAGGGGNHGNVLLLPIYSVKKDRKVTPDSKFHGFMAKASMMAALKMNEFFIINAEKQIAKYAK